MMTFGNGKRLKAFRVNEKKNERFFTVLMMFCGNIALKFVSLKRIRNGL